MDRRNFLAAAAAASAAPLSALDAQATAIAQPARQLIELRWYHLLPGAKQRAFSAYLRDAAIPAMNRAGVTPVGAFTVMYGTNAPSMLLALTHKSMDTVVGLRDRMAADQAHATAGAAVVDAPLSEPPYVRVESTLLRAIDAMPTVEPAAGVGGTAPRIYELRIYESHSDKAALNKLKMFNAGEVPIFRRVGLTPVFFGETILGQQMPSLVYMLTFADMAARDAAWAKFGPDPEWRTLSADPQYRENVSAISDIILRPAPFSQI